MRAGIVDGKVVDSLIVQSKHWRPCMETAGEIALQLKDAGRRVGMYILDTNDPFEPPPWGIWPVDAKKRRKAKALRDILCTHGIECVLQSAEDFKSALERVGINEQFLRSDDVRRFSYDGESLGQGVLSELISSQADPYPVITEQRRLIEQALTASICAYILTERAIEKFSPGEIIVYNARFAVEYAVCCAAKKHNVPLKYYELVPNKPPLKSKFWVGDRSIFELAYMEEVINDLWAHTGENRTAIASEFFFLQRSGRFGTNNYVKLQSKDAIPDKIRKRRISFFTTSEDEIACLPFENSLGSSELFASQREAVLFLIDWVRRQADAELVIRVHPHVSVKHAREQEFWNGLSGENVTLIRSDAKTDSYALMESSDLILSYCSTIGIEATFWGFPSVALAKAAYHGQQCVYEPARIPDLEQLLESGAAPLTRASTLPYGYFCSEFGQEHQYYDPLAGTFCGRTLSMDISAMMAFKESSVGKTLKRKRDELSVYRSGIGRPMDTFRD